MAFQARRAPGEWVPAARAWSPPSVAEPRRPSAGTGVDHAARRFQMLSAALLGAVLVLSAAIGVVISWPSTATTPAASAASLRAEAVQASEHAGWVHVTSLGSTYDVGPGAGTQVISSEDQGNADIVYVGGVAYLRADGTFLADALDLPSAVATDAANRWLSFDPGDPDFLQIANGLTVSSMVGEAIPGGPVHFVGAATMDGQRVQGLAGVQDVLGQTKASLTAWVEAAAPHRIVASVVRADNSGVSLSETIRFSDWGEGVSVSPPAGAIPFVSIGGAPSSPS